MHDDVIKWKHFPRYWPFVRGIHRSPVNSPHTGQWRGALMFSLICVWINGWVNSREAGDLRRYRAHYAVIVMGQNDLARLPRQTWKISLQEWFVKYIRSTTSLIIFHFIFSSLLNVLVIPLVIGPRIWRTSIYIGLNTYFISTCIRQCSQMCLTYGRNINWQAEFFFNFLSNCIDKVSVNCQTMSNNCQTCFPNTVWGQSRCSLLLTIPDERVTRGSPIHISLTHYLCYTYKVITHFNKHFQLQNMDFSKDVNV